MSARPLGYRALLFDLFRTVVVFTAQAPTGQVHEPTWRGAMTALRDQFEPLLLATPFDAFLDALVAASDEIARARAPEYFEVPIAQRYGRALRRLGYEDAHAVALAPRLARIQLAAQVANTALPRPHTELLQQLAPRYRLGLVSNFDDAAASHAVLVRHGLDRVFASIVTSIEHGRRKPHAAIFQHALSALGIEARAALFIGDSPVEDVGGAHGAGLDTAWLNVAGTALPAGVPQPTYVLRCLTDLQELTTEGHRGHRG